MLAPGSGRQAIQKKAHRIDNHLGSATSQTQERKKEANKRITTLGSPHRGGLGAAHSDYHLHNMDAPNRKTQHPDVCLSPPMNHFNFRLPISKDKHLSMTATLKSAS